MEIEYNPSEILVLSEHATHYSSTLRFDPDHVGPAISTSSDYRMWLATCSQDTPVNHSTQLDAKWLHYMKGTQVGSINIMYA